MLDPQIEKNLANLKDFLNSKHNKTIVGKAVDSFIKIIGYSRYCIENDVLAVDEGFIKDVFESFTFLEHLYINEPVSREMAEFVGVYTLLIFNIDKNIVHNPQLSDRCRLVDNIYRDFLTVRETFDFLKQLIRQNKSMINYALPSVEISQHYLESFNKKNEVKEKKELKEQFKPPVPNYSDFKGN